MKAKVYVTLKPGVLDPQGKAIQHSAESLGYGQLTDIRQGKYFEVVCQAGTDPAAAQEMATRLADQVLANPVIEDYRVEIEP